MDRIELTLADIRNIFFCVSAIFSNHAAGDYHHVNPVDPVKTLSI